jgi:hypothetical protein
LIGTVRNVGYKVVPPARQTARPEADLGPSEVDESEATA